MAMMAGGGTNFYHDETHLYLLSPPLCQVEKETKSLTCELGRSVFLVKANLDVDKIDRFLNGRPQIIIVSNHRDTDITLKTFSVSTFSFIACSWAI